jgi:N-acylglucosamine-6-phosphate 2-epimerase
MTAAVFDALKGRLVVSVQADEGSPMRSTPIIVAMALCAERGGAAGLRIQSVDDVAGVRAASGLPIIGLVKAAVPGSAVYITPTTAHALALVAAGADAVAVDATLRERPESFAAIAAAVHGAGAAVLADVSTVEEARAAYAAGADLVATTLSGYTGGATPEGPDFDLMRDLARAGLPFAAEGRIRTPEEAAEARATGAAFVIVGSAITRPDVVTGWFATAVTQAV